MDQHLSALLVLTEIPDIHYPAWLFYVGAKDQTQVLLVD